jgi:hypothetical protein
MPTETQLVARIMLMLERRGAYANKNHGSPFQRLGRPDIEGCLDGSFFAFEVKLPGKKHSLTRLQVQALIEIREAGGCAEVVESVQEAEDLLRAWNLA